MADLPVYPATILILLIVGLVPALVFISQHRPKQWRRLAAWDASGWVIIFAFLYIRSIVLLVARWPGAPPKGWLDVVFAVGFLVVIDMLLIFRVVSYRSFAQRDAERIAENRTDVIT